VASTTDAVEDPGDGLDIHDGNAIPADRGVASALLLVAGENGDVRSSTAQDQVTIPREIWILVGAAFVIAIGYGIISPVLPAYARSFDVGVAAASVIVSAFAFFRLVFAPAGGELVSRLGERPVYLAGLLIVAASSFATAFSQSYVQLLAFRGLGGIGSTMFTISAMALLVRLAPPSARGRVSSAYGSAFLIGGMIGPLLGGLLAGWGLRAPFIVYAAALLVAAAVVAIGLGGARLRPAEDRATREVMTLAEAWRSPVYRAVLASGLANGWTNFGVRLAVLPLLAIAVLDRPWVAGAALAIGAVGTAGTLQVSGRMADRIGRRPLVIGGLLVMGTAMALLGLAQHPALSVEAGLTMLFGLSLISGVGAGLVNPAQQAAVADVVGLDRNGGKVFSTFQMAQDLGAIGGPILVGLVADTFGYGSAFLVTGLVCLLGVLPWLSAPEPLTQAIGRPRDVT
jgi:MFS family permease